jgi:hypothetical protein
MTGKTHGLFMKVTGPTGLTSASAGASSKPGAVAPGFTLDATSAATSPAATARAAGASAVASTDALLALQEVEGPLERRRRAVKRGGRLLDALDTLKVALLGDGSSTTALQGLARAVRESRADAGDPALEGVLDEIETRAAVELAKAEMSRVAA